MLDVCSQGRDNHKRVESISASLKAEGVRTWIDAEQMAGGIMTSMSDGIDDSRAVAVFITKNYLTKVAGRGPNGADDNCKAEFEYSCQRKGVAGMVAVVMEPDCLSTSEWHGPVGMKLGGTLYIDLSSEVNDDKFVAGIAKLASAINAVGSPVLRPAASVISDGGTSRSKITTFSLSASAVSMAAGDASKNRRSKPSLSRAGSTFSRGTSPQDETEVTGDAVIDEPPQMEGFLLKNSPSWHGHNQKRWVRTAESNSRRGRNRGSAAKHFVILDRMAGA